MTVVPVNPNAACFHGQQCAEKYLKALQQEAGRSVPRTHDLGDLLADLVARHPALKSLSRGLHYLTQFAVEYRYPGKKATKRQAAAALRWTGCVRERCRRLLGL